jgi:hypothetical protein
MKRRQFITLFGGAAATWPITSHAQQSGKTRLIGVLMGYAESDRTARSEIAAFRGGLAKLGWTEGSNLRIEVRWGNADPDRIRTSAKELIELRPDVILSPTTLVTGALARETGTIPIVFVGVGDPIASGFAASLARPGGNITGFTVETPAHGGKWVELLKEIAPRTVRMARSSASANLARKREGILRVRGRTPMRPGSERRITGIGERARERSAGSSLSVASSPPTWTGVICSGVRPTDLAATEFISVILLSAFKSNERSFESQRSKLFETVEKQKLSFQRPSFGTWKVVTEYLSKQTRLLLSGDKDAQATCAEVFADQTLGLPKVLSKPELLTVISDTNKMRNDWSGHGGIVGQDVAKVRNDLFLGQVQKLREALGALPVGIVDITSCHFT